MTSANDGDGPVAAPRVSIVLPLYNGARFIAETLRSIQDQTFADFEVLVVDDGSTDSGPDIVREFAKDPRFTLTMKPHLGIAGTRNFGAERAAAEADFLVFMDQDDLWDADVLESLVTALNQRPDASGAFVLADFITTTGELLDPGSFTRLMRTREELSAGRLTQRDPTADLHLEHVFLNNPAYPPSCLMIRRDLFKRLGGFDAGFLVADDWDLVVRLARLGPIVPVDEVKVGYRRHGENASGNTALNVREVRRVWATAYYSPDNTPDQSAALAAVWRAHQARTAASKMSQARDLARSRRALPGLARAADATAHRLLRRPLRRWARPVATP